MQDHRLKTATIDAFWLPRNKRICTTTLILVLSVPFARAAPTQEFASTRAPSAIAAPASPAAEPVSAEPAAPVLFGTECTPPSFLLIPATLGGVDATLIEPTGGRQLHCISLLNTRNVWRAASVSQPVARVTGRAPSTTTGAAAEGLTGAESGSDSGTPAPASFPVITFRMLGLADPSVTPLLPTGCAQDGVCDRLAATASPARPERIDDADGSAREPVARPRKPARTPINPRLPSWLGLWLASWLMLLGLSALAWIYFKRRFGPDARLVRAARSGLRKGEFRLEYQPVVSLRDGRCVGVEALIRWNNPEHGSLGPAHYMGRLEHTALIGPLTRFVLSTAARELGPLMADSPLYIGVNVSSSHVQSATFVSDVRRAGKRILSRLVLHMPESQCARPTANVLNALAALRAKKVRFALSGVGASLVDPDLIKVYAFELVKIDRQVLALETDERRRCLTAVVDASRLFGATVVAEGVESAGHHTVVSQSGADFGQGFFYGRTMVISLLRTFLEAGGTSLRMQKKRRWR
ncbi:EAL domain-containing protein [Paraburkholderia sp. Cpub6]|uniref:EAL domain-containing protein n=1 Tax=Paraburkholderia sp. Cpub6 TaxID=2723094 RepID=UPI00160BC6E2|nr:EAL domain-containing protein [Paraburkholderia sp. Cpub6]MBB5462303.1 EAL domain-containing protein (putative c-di-GMP-specific phosphodiesterase class I) [Paraburkholderia sp. Cpub6]